MDAAKGFGIILVVLGHDLRGLISAGVVSNVEIPQFIDRWIYSFHMPLFFLLAGLFVPQSFNRWSELRIFLEGKLATIAYPYFVWSVLTIALKSCLGSIPNTPRQFSDVLHIIYAPVEQYWFLYALFLIFGLYALARRLGLSTAAITCLSAAVWIFSISTRWPILNVALSESFYFCTGALLAGILADDDGPFRSPAFLVLALALSLVGLGKDSQPFAALAGICFAIALVQLLPKAIARMLGFLGRFALEIYLTHSIISAAVRVLLFHSGINAPPIHLATGLVAGVFVPLALGYVSRKYVPYVFALKIRG